MLPDALLPADVPPAPVLEPAPALPLPVAPAPLVPVALPVRELDPAPEPLAIDPLDDTCVRMNPPLRLLPLLAVDPAPPAVDEPAPPALDEPEDEPLAACRHPVTVIVCPLLCDCPPLLERVLELPEPDCPLPVLPLPVVGCWAPTPTASAALNIVPKMN